MRISAIAFAGLVFFSGSAFAAGVADETTIAQACKATVRVSGYEPVTALRGAESYGSDRSAEPFVLAIMEAASDWRGLADRATARSAVAELARWARSEALTEVVEVGPDRSNTNSIYSLRRALIGLLSGWSDLKNAADASERGTIQTWLAHLVAIQDTDTGGIKGRGGPGAVSNHNNHAYLRATVNALWAVETGDRALASRSAAIAREAVETMRSDGSLPLETSRGARALWYQRHAIASLIYLAEILRPLGHDLWAPRADGHSLHDAVSFLVSAIQDPSRVETYASENKNPKPGSHPQGQDLGFLEPRGHGRHYMAWVEIYRARFPNTANAVALQKLVRPTLEAAQPMIDEIVGGNTTCRIFLSSRRL